MGTLKKKLSSRKFWVALGAWATSLLTAFNVTESAIAQAAIIISGVGALAAYMLAEGMADKPRNDIQTVITVPGELEAEE